jgi:hypothetical protein
MLAFGACIVKSGHRLDEFGVIAVMPVVTPIRCSSRRFEYFKNLNHEYICSEAFANNKGTRNIGGVL